MNYHQELEKEIIHFLVALDQFQVAEEKDKKRLEGVMNTHLQLIHAAANEIPRSGMHKEIKIFEHAFRDYLANQNGETFTALHHAVSMLREYNR